MHEEPYQTLARYRKMLSGIKDKDSWFYKFILKKGILLKKTVDLKKIKVDEMVEDRAKLFDKTMLEAGGCDFKKKKLDKTDGENISDYLYKNVPPGVK